MASIMHVQKRNGDLEEVSFDKVLNRIRKLSDNLHVNVFEIAQKVCSRIYDGVKTTELDELAAQLCSSMMLEHPDYGTMASRIIISNHHKNTSPSFSETIQVLYDNTDASGMPNPLVSKELYDVVQKNKEKLNVYIDYSRDYDFDYFGFKTLEKAYLLRVKGRVVERPQQMLMRVAIGIHGLDLKDALQTYDMMSRKYFVHATPTLFNAGTPRPQCSSCFLVASNDSIVGIYDTLKECAMISKYAGGIGMHIHDIRARNSIIRGTNGTSTGIVPMLRVFNNTARYVNQCFAPDTPVYTHVGAKNIASINVGDMVLTADGSFKRVLCKFVNHVDRDILEIRNKYTFRPIHVTKEHKILTYNKDLNQIQYKYADEIQKDTDMVGYATSNIQIKQEEDCDYFKFYGLLVKNGKVFANGEDFCLTCTNDESFTFATQFLRSRGIRFWVYRSKTRPTSIIRWLKQVTKLNITRMHMYVDGKRAMYSNFMYLEKDVRDAFIDGLRLASKTHQDWQCLEFDDERIALDIKYILLQSGIVARCYNNGSKYTVHIPKSNVNDEVVCAEGMFWVPIDDITPYAYRGNVYDLNVEDNHNYTTTLGVVHNSGRRNGSIAIYLEPWHADIESFLDLRKNHGSEEERARDLFYALWIPDLFMKRVKEDGMWSLMCPDTSKGLSDTYGEAFDTLYEKYEAECKFVKQVKAQDLWFKILESQIETGTPYMLYKDHVNRKSNQMNLGVIKSSNLCTEITEYTSDKETAVCNLASICLPTYVEQKDGKAVFNHEKLHDATKILVKNLNKVIDRTFYPVEKAKTSNLLHRPIGIGVQGLADTFVLMRLPFDSDQANTLNKDIFETMYHAAVESSMELAKKHEKTYSSFKGSPASMGVLQFDMWHTQPSERYDWKKLKEDVVQYGMLNSLLLAPMPTASTSQIMGFNEAFEPFTSNIYKRKTLAGEFILVNKYLIKDLQNLGIWNTDMKNKIILNDGSVQSIPEIPQDVKDLYKIVWEIKQKVIIDMAADRGAFIDQSQSMNLFMENPDFKKLSSMHFYAWQKGLKTGMYYLRTKAKAKAQQFTMDPKLSKYTNIKDEMMANGACESCSA